MSGDRSRSRDPNTTSHEEKTRAEIQAAARALVERHGFGKVTLEDIAGALGKKRSFLYYYYQDKESIFDGLIASETRAIQGVVDDVIALEPTGLARIKACILTVHREVRARFPFIRQIRDELRARNRDTLGMLFDRSVDELTASRPFMENLIRQGVEDGSLRHLAESEIVAVARFVAFVLHGVEYDYLLGSADEHFDDYLRRALDVLEHGIAA